jgi:predicted O-methyltransferase YrrM
MTYEAALAKVRAASEVFAKATVAYRAREISDADFCAAFAANKAANEEFDAAFIEAQNAPEVVAVEDDTEVTLDLFAA